MSKRLVALLAGIAMLSTAVLAQSAKAAPAPPKSEMIYFVMLDRFANGDTSNDFGSAGSNAQVWQSGLLKSDSGYYHGGDIKGVSNQIPYIKNLGFTAIWVTPIVRQNTTQGGSAAYHGYWGLGFDQVDSHLGTMQDWKDFVNAAHAAGLKVILDIVINHTGDIIKYGTGNYSYESSTTAPYKTSTGTVFDPKTVAGLSTFPTLSPTVSFTKRPYVESWATNIKSPSWLNNVVNYHNRGDSTWSGESVQWGDFYGLDDLFTESPAVVNGFTSVYQNWINNTGVDGFRIDTAKHVNEAFWKSFLPAMRSAASSTGKSNFPMWGEVWDGNVYNTSYWIKNAGYNEVLDFPFQGRALDFVNNRNSWAMASLFNDDDLYVTENTTANNLGTFLGNHDMGRVGLFLSQATTNTTTMLSRDKLAHALMFGVRGNPIVYYGDEFGLRGTGGDKASRQDLFATQVSSWRTEPRIGGTSIGTKSSFDTTNPLQATIRSLTSLRANNSAFSTGPKVVRISDAGLLIISSIDPITRIEHIAMFNTNSATATATASLSTSSPKWTLLTGTGTVTSSLKVATMKPTAFGYGFFKASIPVPTPSSVAVTMNSPTTNNNDSSLITLSARVTGSEYNSVEFFVQTSAGGAWQSLGADDMPTVNDGSGTQAGLYRAMPLKSQFAKGATLNFRAVVTGVGGVTSTSPTVSYTNN